MEKKDPKRPRIVVVPLPYQGHINPMLQLATFLRRQGFSVTVAHTFYNSLDPSQHPEFEFLRLHDGLSDDAVSTWDRASIVLAINENCRTSFEEKVAAMAERDGEGSGEVVCIIHDELMYFCEAVANRLKTRSVVFRTTNVAACLSRIAVSRLQSEGHYPVEGSSLEEEVPQLHPLRFKDLPFPAASDFFKFTQIIAKMYSITTSSAVIWNTIAWLEQPQLTEMNHKNAQIPIFPIGPIHKIASATASLLEEDSKCLDWLDKQAPNSVIYISLGSLALLTQKEVQEMAWGLANSMQPFLWVVRPGSVHGSGHHESIPQGFEEEKQAPHQSGVIEPGSIRGSDRFEFMPRGFEEEVGERGCIVKWAPQKEVLAHRAVGGFWSHCGWNSTLESLSEGVPILCRPYSGDQGVNTRYIDHVWRVGFELEGELERKKIEGDVRRMMGEEGEEMRERAMDFKERIEASVKEGGSSSCKLKELVDLIKSFQV